MEYFRFLFILSAFPGLLPSSGGAQDLTQNGGINSAIEFYQERIGTRSLLFQGREFIEYDNRIQGDAFFRNDDWETGSLIYNDIFYPNTWLRYDLVADVLVVDQKGLANPIILESSQVEWFLIFDHQFVWISGDLVKNAVQSGFYDLRVDGAVSFLVKRRKFVKEEIDNVELRVKKWFEEKTQYYIACGDSFIRIKSKRSLLNELEAHKKAVRRLLKKSSLRFRANPEESILLAVKYYNQA